MPMRWNFVRLRTKRFIALAIAGILLLVSRTAHAYALEFCSS
jgi:hypothetical protein